MKRKALITSTAILLVALMCLATASYAWFTANGVTKINTFEVNVSGADQALELSVDQESWYSVLSKKDFTDDNQVVSGELQALSSTDCETFYAAPYVAATNSGGKSVVANDNYILIDFYAKAPVAGTATFDIDFGGLEAGSSAETNFMSAVKIGYNGVTYDLANDTVDYKTMNAKDAIAIKEDGAFVPGFDTDDKYSTDARSSNIWQAQDVTFVAGEAQHFEIAIWLEGMDKDCVGNFTMEDVTVDISFGTFSAN